jgi:hypothetical protein
MPIYFMKAHSVGCGYVVINKADTVRTDLPEVARRLCSLPLGVGADGMAVIEHLGFFRFAVRCLCPDGSGSPPGLPMLRCCARAIQIRYGYRSLILVTEGGDYQAQVAGQDIGICFPELTEAGSSYQLPEQGSLHLKTGAGPVATLARQVNPLWSAAPPAIAVRQPPPDSDASAVERERQRGLLLRQQGRLDAALWPYEPAILLFAGEFPWT